MGYTCKELKEITEAAGLEVRSYSGRGMYGKICLAIETEDGGSVFSTMGTIVKTAIEIQLDRHIEDSEESEKSIREELEKLDELFVGTKTDAMGLGSVMYFPEVEWETDDNNDEDESHADEET